VVRRYIFRADAAIEKIEDWIFRFTGYLALWGISLLTIHHIAERREDKVQTPGYRVCLRTEIHDRNRAFDPTMGLWNSIQFEKLIGKDYECGCEDEVSWKH
jgi:hypothetical protein